MTSSPWLPLADAALRGALLALLLLLAVTLWRTRSALPLVRLSQIFVLGLAVQTVSGWPAFEQQVPLQWQAPLVGISVANAMLFWLFVRALFEDDFRLSRQQALLWLAVATTAAAACTVGASATGHSSAAAPVLWGLLRWMPVLFAGLCVVAAARQAKADLVEGRRRLRVFFFAFGATYTVAMAALRLSSGQGRLDAPASLGEVAGLLLCVALGAALLLRVSGASLGIADNGLPVVVEHLREPALTSAKQSATLRGPDALTRAPPPLPTTPALAALAGAAAAAQPPQADPAEEQLAQALEQLMAQQHFYRTEDLTLAVLARQLDAPEYRLRRLINQRWGHRNFNAYVNGLRLMEVQAALLDPSQRHLPVLTIALTAGFGSIGPFNRAFKAATGLTPTEFRERSA